MFSRRIIGTLHSFPAGRASSLTTLSITPWSISHPLVASRAAPRPRRPPTSTTTRTMASASTTSTTSSKFEWLVVVPDKPGMLARRLEVRPTHFQNLGPNIENGTFKTGGALLTEIPKDDKADSMKFYGSTLVVVAESKDEVMDILNKDIYAESGVWDLENVQMWPFKCAFRNP